MPLYTFRPVNQEAPKFEMVQKPYWKLTINARDIPNTYYTRTFDEGWVNTGDAVTVYHDPGWWTEDNTDSQRMREGNINITGVDSGKVSYQSKTFSIEKTGYYQFMLRYMKRGVDTGSIELFVDSVQVGSTISTVGQQQGGGWNRLETYQFPLVWMKEGDHDVSLRCSSTAWMIEFFMYPVTRYVATNEGYVEKGAEYMDCKKLDFTENNVTENNYLTAHIPLEDHLFNENNESLSVFEFKDSVTLELGHDYKSAIAKFGGYVVDPIFSDDDIIEVKCMDRMLDLITQTNQYILYTGTAPEGMASEPTNKQQTYLIDVASCLVNTLEYPLDFSYQTSIDGYSRDFLDEHDFYKAIPNQYLNATYDPLYGLKISPKAAGTGEIVLWQSTPEEPSFDANHTASNTVKVEDAGFPGFGLYYNYGAFANPIPFDLVVYIYKAGQTPAQATPYHWQFIGGVPNPNMGTPSISSSNAKNWTSIDMKASMDAHSSSTEYHIAKISLMGTITSQMVNNPNDYGLYVYGHKFFYGINYYPNAQYSTLDSKNHFDALQKLCEDNNFVARIVPGKERYQDSFYITHAHSEQAPIELSDKEGNIYSVSNWAYDPLGNDLCNYRNGIYNSGGWNAYGEDIESIKRYGRVKTREELTDIGEDTTSAQNSVNKYVTDHGYVRAGADIKIEGSVLFRPEHYVLTDINNRRLRSAFPIKGISHEYDLYIDEFTTTLGVNRLPSLFRQRQRKLWKFMKNYRRTRY